MTRRSQVTLTAALSTLALAQAVQLTAHREVVRPAVAYVRATTGSVLTASVASGVGTGSVPISSIGGGACSFIVVYSGTCGASQVAHRRWVQEAGEDPRVFAVPGWRFAWVAVDDPGEAGRAGSLPFGHFRVTGPRHLEQEAGITAYPVHIVLDRGGKVVSSGVGADLPDELQFHSDCTTTSGQTVKKPGT